MTSDSFEELIQYRRQLREQHADAVTLRWGLTSTVVTYPSRRVWHLTRHAEAPCAAECGYQLVELGPRGMKQPWKVCKRCRDWSEAFVDLWQQG